MSLFRLLWPGIRRQWRWLLLGVILALLSLVAAAFLLGLSGWFITAGALAGAGLIVGLDIFTPGAGIRLAAVTRTLARYGERLASHEATFRLLADLRQRLFENLLIRDEYSLRQLRRGDALDRLTRDVETLDHMFTGVLGPVVAACVLGLAVAGGFALMGAVPAALAVLVVLVLNLLAMLLIARTGRTPTRQRSAMEPNQRMLATEGLEGMEILKAFNRVNDWSNQLGNHNRHMVELGRMLARLDAVGQGLTTLIGLGGLWSVLVAGIMLTEAGVITTPVMVLLVLVMLALTEAWQPLPGAWRRLAACRVAAERAGELLKPSSSRSATASTQRLPREHSIEAINLSFRYQESLPPLLANLDIFIEAGERVVLIGPSGGGKTTLALLLMGQLAPTTGRVLYGGCNIDRIGPDELRRAIGYLPQRPVVFRDSLANNLRLAAPEASDAELSSVIERVGLDRLMHSLPDGLDSWIGEGGADISGGELRRIALARLLLTDPHVVILDEPTTGLDAASARAMKAGLNGWLGTRTVIMISHDPALLPRYDRSIRIGSDSTRQRPKEG